MLGAEPDWLPQALEATKGRADNPSIATVLICAAWPESLPPRLRRVILIGGLSVTVPPEITLSRPEDWTYSSESSAD